MEIIDPIEIRLKNIEIKLISIENMLEKIYNMNINTRLDSEVIVQHVKYIEEEYNMVSEPIKSICNFVMKYKNKLPKISNIVNKTIEVNCKYDEID